MPKYDCVTCTAQQKIERGCEVPIEGFNVLLINGVEQRRCPRRPILERPDLYGELFWLHRQSTQGQFPESGGLEGQPSKLMVCLREIDIAVGDVERFKEERDTEKRRRTAMRPGRSGVR